MTKRVVRVSLIVLVLIVMAGFVVGQLLRSRYVADKVTAALEKQYGGAVKVSGVAIGLTGSSLSGLELFEQDQGHGDPWLSVKNIETDLSVFGVLRGHMAPSTVHLVGANVLLRFDREGRLLTSLPPQLFRARQTAGMSNSIPEIELDRSQITLRKDGATDLVLSDVRAKLGRDNDQVVVSGTAENPSWGKWGIAGQLRKDGALLSAQLRSEGAPVVTEAMLAQIPFVPNSAWREVEIVKATASAVVNVSYDLRNHQLHYGADVEVAEGTVRLPAASLDVDDVRAKVTVQDQRIDLRDVQGKAFGGTVRGDASIDLAPPHGGGKEQTEKRGPALEMVVDVRRIEAKGLDVGRFPASWEFPKEITGKLQGTASLKVIVTPGTFAFPGVAGVTAMLGSANVDFPLSAGALLLAEPVETKLQTEGAGSGEITEARIAGQPAAEPIGLKLHPVPGGFRFSKGSPRARAAFAAAEGVGQGGDTVFGQSFVNALVPFFARVQPKNNSNESKPPAQKKGPAYLDVHLKMADADLGKFEHDVNIKLPFALAGKLSFDVKASIPIGDTGDLKKYKAQGSAQLKQFVFGDLLRLDSLETEVALADGMLRVPFLKGRVASDHAPVAPSPVPFGGERPTGDAGGGRIEGSGSFQIAPLGDLRVSVSLQNILLSQIARIGKIAEPVEGDVSGTLNALISGKNPEERTTWQASAKLTSKRAAAFGWNLLDASVDLSLDRGQLVLNAFDGKLDKGSVRAAGQLQIVAPYRFGVKINLQDADLAPIAHLAPQLGIPVSVTGSVQAAANLKGSIEPLHVEGEANLKAPQLRVQNIVAEELRATIDFQKNVIRYRLDGKALGGTFDVEGQVPPPANSAPPGGSARGGKGRVKVSAVRIGPLLRALSTLPRGARLSMGETARDFDGQLYLDFEYSHDTKDGGPVGDGRVRLANLRYRGNPLAGDIAGNVKLSGSELRLQNIPSELGQGVLRAQIALNFKKWEQGWFVVNLDGVQASALLAPWLDDKVKGPMQARIRGRMGSEWAGSADIEMTQGQIMGLTVSAWRLPLRFRYAPAEGRGEFESADIRAQVGTGQLTGKVDLNWQDTMRISGNLILTRADMGTLLRQTAGAAGLGGGLLSARFDFAGHEMRSLDDLTGTLQGSFEQAQAFNVPVLKEISPFIGIGPGTTFQKGSLQARLGRGSLTIQALSLDAVNYQVFIQGTVSLQGRLDLDATANTGNLGIGTPRLRLLGVRLPIAGPVPLVIAQEAASLLANRVIHARVTGALPNPTVRILPLATLTQEAARFFLSRAIGQTSSGGLSAIP
jgi:hypothetical protein